MRAFCFVVDYFYIGGSLETANHEVNFKKVFVEKCNNSSLAIIIYLLYYLYLI